MLEDRHYLESQFTLSEVRHNYGSHVHLLADPYHEHLLARFCSADVVQPEANELLKKLYECLCMSAVNHLFPKDLHLIRTRMADLNSRGTFKQMLLSQDPRVVVVDLMRAGIFPSHLCYELLHSFLPADHLRQDHILLNRKVNEREEVIGVQMSGFKIGGGVTDAFVFLPDPMGATGSSVNAVIDLYHRELPKRNPVAHGTGQARKFIALHLIVTPEYLQATKSVSDKLEIFAFRLDRGMSEPEVLKTSLGAQVEREQGLNEKHYIVPGAGGIGEILNNSFT